MTFVTTRRHRTEFQEADYHRNRKILIESWRISPIRGLIHNLGWTQLESELKIQVKTSSLSFTL